MQELTVVCLKQNWLFFVVDLSQNICSVFSWSNDVAYSATSRQKQDFLEGKKNRRFLNKEAKLEDF